MAVRLARAFTGKPKLIRFNYHFHGWHDHMTSGHTNHFDGTPTTGVLDAVAGNVLLCDQNDEAALARLLEQHDGEIAAAIIEPTGANGGRLPIDPEFLHALRRLTAEHGVLLIFDEVVNGFRVAPGGAQEAYGIRPDLTTLAKILAGGLPGGAVDRTQGHPRPARFPGDEERRQGKDRASRHVQRQSAVGGGRHRLPQNRAETDACARANQYGEDLRTRLNEVFEEERVPWAAYGTFSSLEMFMNPERAPITPTRFDPLEQSFAALKSDRTANVVHKMRLGMMINGVDLSSHPGGVISATHGEQELEDTVAAMRNTVRMLRAEGRSL